MIINSELEVLDKLLLHNFEQSALFQKEFDEVSGTGKLTSGAKESYSKGAKKLNELGTILSTKPYDLIKINDRTEERKQVLDQDSNELKRKTDNNVTGLIGGAGILDDPLASAVAYAPLEHWQGQFNCASCTSCATP